MQLTIREFENERYLADVMLNGRRWGNALKREAFFTYRAWSLFSNSNMKTVPKQCSRIGWCSLHRWIQEDPKNSFCRCWSTSGLAPGRSTEAKIHQEAEVLMEKLRTFQGVALQSNGSTRSFSFECPAEHHLLAPVRWSRTGQTEPRHPVLHAQHADAPRSHSSESILPNDPEENLEYVEGSTFLLWNIKCKN